MRSGVTLEIFEPARGTDYDIIFAGIREAGADALAIGAHPEFFADAAALAAKAVEARLPTVCEWADMARAGCLLGYGPSRPELRRRVASLVARIFNGAAPADLPIERPAAFEFVVNLKTAAALGIAVPAAILARADEVIE